jgi:hypothetical protein
MKKIQLMVLVFFLSLAFISCKKTSVNEETNSISQEQASIQLWLTSQKVNNTTARVKLLDALGKNLLFDRLWVEKNNELQFIIVPVNETYKFSNNKGNKVSSYFVSVMRADSKILYSVIIQNRPTNEQNGTAIKKGDIADIYSDKSVKEDCNIRFVTIYDHYLYENKYKNNKLVSTANLNHKNKTDNQNSLTNSISNSTTTQQIDWYLVTTYFYTDGSSETTSVYLYTTYYGYDINNPDYPTTEPSPESGNGSDPGTGVVRNVVYTIKEYQSGNEHWIIEGGFTISGIVFNDIANNFFTSIVQRGVPGCVGLSNLEPAYSSQPYMTGYIVFTSSHTCSLTSSTVASAYCTGNLFFPNWPTYRNEAHSLPKAWQASTDLY